MSELAELQAQILELQKKANRIAIQEKAATLEDLSVYFDKNQKGKARLRAFRL